MGQHKFNPVAQAAKEGKIPQKPPRASTEEARRKIAGVIAKYMWLDRLMAAMNGQLPADHPMLQHPRKIKTWEELDGMTSWDGRYKVEVDFEHGNGKIVPTFEVPDGEWVREIKECPLKED